jgi:hypothetical protein
MKKIHSLWALIAGVFLIFALAVCENPSGGGGGGGAKPGPETTDPVDNSPTGGSGSGSSEETPLPPKTATTYPQLWALMADPGDAAITVDFATLQLPLEILPDTPAQVRSIIGNKKIIGKTGTAYTLHTNGNYLVISGNVTLENFDIEINEVSDPNSFPGDATPHAAITMTPGSILTLGNGSMLKFYKAASPPAPANTPVIPTTLAGSGKIVIKSGGILSDALSVTTHDLQVWGMGVNTIEIQTTNAGSTDGVLTSGTFNLVSLFDLSDGESRMILTKDETQQTSKLTLQGSVALATATVDVNAATFGTMSLELNGPLNIAAGKTLQVRTGLFTKPTSTIDIQSGGKLELPAGAAEGYHEGTITVQSGGELAVSSSHEIWGGENTNDGKIIVYSGGTVKVGPGTWVGAGGMVQLAGGSRIEVGNGPYKNTLFGNADLAGSTFTIAGRSQSELNLAANTTLAIKSGATLELGYNSVLYDPNKGVRVNLNNSNSKIIVEGGGTLIDGRPFSNSDTPGTNDSLWPNSGYFFSSDPDSGIIVAATGLVKQGSTVIIGGSGKLDHSSGTSFKVNDNGFTLDGAATLKGTGSFGTVVLSSKTLWLEASTTLTVSDNALLSVPGPDSLETRLKGKNTTSSKITVSSTGRVEGDGVSWNQPKTVTWNGSIWE